MSEKEKKITKRSKWKSVSLKQEETMNRNENLEKLLGRKHW